MEDVNKTEICTTCKGNGDYKVLVSQHDDETEIVSCPKCNGKGTVRVMTDDEEREYWYNYW
jgi:DnaJ-class molecular chaperone